MPVSCVLSFLCAGLIVCLWWQVLLWDSLSAEGRKHKSLHFKHCSVVFSALWWAPVSPTPQDRVRGSVNSIGGLGVLPFCIQSCFPGCFPAFLKECPAELAIKLESFKSTQNSKVKMYRKTWQLVRPSYFLYLLNVFISPCGIQWS